MTARVPALHRPKKGVSAASRAAAQSSAERARQRRDPYRDAVMRLHAQKKTPRQISEQIGKSPNFVRIIIKEAIA